MGSGPNVHVQISRYIQANSFLCEVGMGSGPNVTMHISRYQLFIDIHYME